MVQPKKRKPKHLQTRLSVLAALLYVKEGSKVLSVILSHKLLPLLKSQVLGHKLKQER